MYDELVATMRRQCVEMSCGNCGTCVNRQAADAIEELSKRVPVPPHGRLIDADELFKEMERKGWFDNADRDKAEDLVLAAPTIIPAEEGE